MWMLSSPVCLSGQVACFSVKDPRFRYHQANADSIHVIHSVEADRSIRSTKEQWNKPELTNYHSMWSLGKRRKCQNSLFCLKFCPSSVSILILSLILILFSIVHHARSKSSIHSRWDTVLEPVCIILLTTCLQCTYSGNGDVKFSPHHYSSGRCVRSSNCLRILMVGFSPKRLIRS